MGVFRVVVSSSKSKASDGAFTGPPCPACGQPMLEGSRYCYRCNHFLDAAGSRALKCGEVSDQELEALIMRSDLSLQEYTNHPGSVQSRKIALLSIIGMFLGVFLMLFNHLFLGIVILIGSVVGGVGLSRKVQPPAPPDIIDEAGFRQLLANYVVPYVLSGSFDRVEVYDPRGGIEGEFIRSSGLLYEDFNTIASSEFIRAVYHGVPVDLSNVHLQYATKDEDDKTHYDEVFNGIIMVCSLGVPVQSAIHIVRKRLGLRAKHAIQTDHEAFNDKFLVTCADEATAFRFLTPHVMEAILKLDLLAGGRSYFVVMPDGRVCMGVDNNKKILQAGAHGMPMAQIRDQMENELQFPLSLIDTINSAHLNR